jgi:hypothetical protein
MQSLVGLLARCRSPGFASLSGPHLLAFSELAFGRGRGRYYISRARPHPRPWQMGFLFSLSRFALCSHRSVHSYFLSPMAVLIQHRMFLHSPVGS